VASADTTGADPKLLTQGCGGKGQPACDAEFLTPGSDTVTVTETFTCDISGNCTASDTVVNATGADLSSFNLVLSNPGSLVYSCGPATAQFFSCNQTGPDSFNFAGATLCSDADDLHGTTFTPDGDECGVIISLTGTTAEGLFTGETVTGSVSTPEPSSALLLLFGLSAGLLAFKKITLS
jgi:hypothetical protein